MLKEKTPNTRRETREKPSLRLTCRFSSDSLKSSLSINFKPASNNPSAWISENVFINNRIAQGRPPVFVMTAQRHQEFSTNVSTEDSRIISEKRDSIAPFYLLKSLIIIESETKVTWHCGKVYLFFFFLFKCLYVRL